MSMTYEQLQQNRKSMSADVTRIYGPKLRGTLKRIFVASPYASVAQLKAWIENDTGGAIETMMLWNGVGQTGVGRLFELLRIPMPVYEEPELTDVIYKVYHTHQLDADEISLIRKLISAHLSICSDGDIADHLRVIRDKL